MPKTTVVYALLLAITTPFAADADSYGPFRNFREVDATGRYYVVFKKNGGPEDPGAGTPVTFAIAERRAGSAPVSAVEDDGDDEHLVANPEVKVREGDTLLGTGKLDRCPSEIVISSSGLGFVGFDVRGYNYGNVRNRDALIVVSQDGKVRHRKCMLDLFDEPEIARFTRSAGGIWWFGGAWIDETRKEIVVLGSQAWPRQPPIPRLLRVVSWETGKVRAGSPAAVVTALREKNVGAFERALGLAAELRITDTKPDLVTILSDQKLGIELRLRAAFALAVLGDRRGGDLFKQAVFEESAGRDYAIQHLPLVAGDEAAPILCALVRRLGGKWSNAAWQAMHHVQGKSAVPALVTLLREGHCPVCIDFAVETLELKGHDAKPALPDLIKLLESNPKTDNPVRTQELAAEVLGKIGPEAAPALPALARLAELRAPQEWAAVKLRQPAPRNDGRGEPTYSDDEFVNAICKIRRK